MKFEKNTKILSLHNVLIVLILITTIFVSIKFNNNKTEVLFADLPGNVTYTIDQKTTLYLVKSNYYNLKRSLNNLSPGTHIIHYDTSPVTRYYARIDVKKGRNIIKPVFEYHSLPSLSVYRKYSGRSANKVTNKKSFTYETFSANGISQTNVIEIDINQEIIKKPDSFLYNFSWDLMVNNKSVSSTRFSKSDSKGSDDNVHKQIIFQDQTHHYTAEYFFTNGTAKLKIWSNYL